MKVLWVCSFAPDMFAGRIGIQQNLFGGWISGAMKMLIHNNSIELAVCFPQRISKELLSGQVNQITYYGFPLSGRDYDYDKYTESYCKQIIKDFQPDVIHIWGTEFPYAYAMTKAVVNPKRLVCSIQGLCGVIANHYYSHLPMDIIKRYTLRDLLRLDNIEFQKKQYEKRGIAEERILNSVGNVIGRTEWDMACSKQLAPSARYHFCNETLRTSFYEHQGSWNATNCEKYSIFVSQANYPIKGFHIMLEAMPKILKMYPDAKLYTTGPNPSSISFYRRGSYQQYIKQLIEKYNLRNKVVFLGSLSEKQMCERYMRSNVFVSASSIENSPNSVGESMLLGMPIVASYVGGTMDLLRDKVDGFLYQMDAPYMLAHYVCKLFDDEILAQQMGQQAHKHASITHNPEINCRQLLEIYNEISNA